MIIKGKHYFTIRLNPADQKGVQIIDQRHLSHQLLIEDLCTVEQVATAIRDMHVRGAGRIGATAEFGMYLATLEASSCSKQN